MARQRGTHCCRPHRCGRPDTANKLVIVSNEVLDTGETRRCECHRNIRRIAREVREALRTVSRFAWWQEQSDARAGMEELRAMERLRHQAPERVKTDSHLGACRGTSMCCRYVTDIFETIDLCTDEKGVYPTAAAAQRLLRCSLLGAMIHHFILHVCVYTSSEICTL